MIPVFAGLYTSYVWTSFFKALMFNGHPFNPYKSVVVSDSPSIRQPLSIYHASSRSVVSTIKPPAHLELMLALIKFGSRVRHPYLRNNFTIGWHCITFPLGSQEYCTNSNNSPLLISISPPFRRRPFGNILTRISSSDVGKLSMGGPMLASVLTTLSVMTKALIFWQPN